VKFNAIMKSEIAKMRKAAFAAWERSSPVIVGALNCICPLSGAHPITYEPPCKLVTLASRWLVGLLPVAASHCVNCNAGVRASRDHCYACVGGAAKLRMAGFQPIGGTMVLHHSIDLSYAINFCFPPRRTARAPDLLARRQVVLEILNDIFRCERTHLAGT
jgi:hypothetical protein